MRELRNQVGLVFQYPEHQLFEIDVMTDVCFGPKNQGLGPKECKERALEALKLVGLKEKYYKSSPFEPVSYTHLCIRRRHTRKNMNSR